MIYGELLEIVAIAVLLGHALLHCCLSCGNDPLGPFWRLFRKHGLGGKLYEQRQTIRYLELGVLVLYF